MADLIQGLQEGSAALNSDVTVPDDGFFTQVDYKGAFGTADLWVKGWSALDSYGYLVGGGTREERPYKYITDEDIAGDVVFKADTIYVLQGLVFVEDGETLTIQSGTVIKANPGQGLNASALVVARGGKIYAEGTPSRPIIFTALADNVDDTQDLPLDARGLWGGVILLGKAGINTADGVGNIEGIPTTEPRGAYGGTDDEDDSGIMRYVSIRHGGTDIGEGNEINGLTFGAVGSGTTIEHIEVFANKDDGYEWFGGTVNTKYLVAALCGDDSFDYDEGFRGNGQFWFALMSDVDGFGNRAGEHDGGTSPEDGTPYAIPHIYNATYIGGGMDSNNSENDLVFIFRDNAGGHYVNSIFTDFSQKALAVEDLTSGEDSRSRLEIGDLALKNNIWYGFGGGSSFADLAMIVNSSGDDQADSYAANYLSNTSNGNEMVDPMLLGISRTNDAGLDPRPSASGPANSPGADVPSDDFFSTVTYKGAFGPNDFWVKNWTVLESYGFLAEDSSQETPDVYITDADIDGDVTWTNDKTYVLQGLVFVEDGETLTIQAGTVIKAAPGQGLNASALVVAQGGKIYAEGNPTSPIIFTALADDVDNPDDLPMDARGLWGGVILLGKAKINTSDGVGNIEGIPTTEPRGAYGGDDDEDDSGVMRYVSIRHGGTDIGEGNEINGLTFGAVGSGTTIEYIEVYANKDDGYEWFGGTVNTKHLVAAMCGDDCFDYDEGFRGKGQFWFAIMSDVDGFGNRAGEHDGGTSPEDGTPYAIPTIYNATYIGGGMDSNNSENDLVFIFRDNAGGQYMNSIFTDFSQSAIAIEDLTSGEDSRARFEAGDLALKNNIWYGFGNGSAFEGLANFVNSSGDVTESAAAYFNDAANGNTMVDPMLRGISRAGDGMLDPRISTDSPAMSGGTTAPDDGFFSQVSYRGAFAANNFWIKDWTALESYGYLAADDSPELPENYVSDADIDGDTHWTSDKVYVLNGLVFVEDGETLTIDPGTVIKANPGQGLNASALIVARGGKIMAEGTADNPIIFTALADNVNDPNDLPKDARGLWGGIILLGKAQINTSEGVGNIEGIPTTEPRGAYGGTDDDDNSGVMRYVSIRHGGTDIGEGNEINGLTFGAVGRGTTIEHIEVFANKDDGYEWFGGTVNTRYLISAFCGDDSFDYDEGFRGMGQFWFTIMDAVDGFGNRGGEHDGGTSPEDGTPYAIPNIYNVTYIGSGMDSNNSENDLVFIFRDNAGGHYMNSIFTDFGQSAIAIEDLDSGEDSRSRLESGDLALQNNIWYGFGSGSTFAELAHYVTSSGTPTTDTGVSDYLSDAANGNMMVDPILRGISHTDDAMLDPRPTALSPAAESLMEIPADGSWLMNVSYAGAFDPMGENWLMGWTALDSYGYVGDIPDESAQSICDWSEDGSVGINDVIAFLLVARDNPNASGLDRNADGKYTIADAINLLITINHGDCSDASVSASLAGVEAPVVVMNLSADDVAYIEEMMAGMNLSEEDETAFRVALYGTGSQASLPKAFSLSQNSPNPFNPSTTVSFSVPEGKNAHVSLNIYDIRGKLVRTLVDEAKDAGSYSVLWNGVDSRGLNVASGVYFYRLAAGEFNQTRKMVLLK